jgi:glycosyltransferase involved in cell wall biosynthesis
MPIQEPDFEPKSHRMMCDRKLLLFDMFYTGHHAGYILHLVRYWREQQLPGTLDVLVSPTFIKSHPDVVTLTLENDQSNINFITITPEEEAALSCPGSDIGRLVRSFQEWSLLQKYVRQLSPTQCLLMYFDSTLLSLAVLGRLPCHLSGIYFRPIFHYSEFAVFKPSPHERLLQLRDKFALSRLLHYPLFQTLFCLDPLVVEHLSRFKGHIKSVYLPDPVQIYSNSEGKVEQLRKNFGIHQNRKVFLMFGSLKKRKGIYQLFDAIAGLPSHICQKVCILFVGPIDSPTLFQNRIAYLCESLPIQIICQDQFIPDRDIQPYFQLADVILAPYQRHIGMSAILVRAATAGKPVLSTNYGLMGEIVKRYKLGIVIDASIPEEIAQGLTQFITHSPEKFFDRSSMQLFAEENLAEKFATTVFQNIWP